MMKWIGEGYAALAGDNKETADADADDPAADPDKKKRKKRKRSTAPSLPMEKCVPLLLNLRLAPQENEEGTVRLDAAGVRTVHHLLRFKDDLVSKSVMDGILTGLDADELEALASDGLGSVCIVDEMLLPSRDRPASSQLDASAVLARRSAATRLREKLAGRWTTLAVGRVGHHAVIGTFRSLPSLEDRAALTAELASSVSRLGGCAMGRSVLAGCLVNEYMEGEERWRDAAKRQVENERWLDDMLQQGEGEGDETVATGKKRKRKRTKKGKGGMGEGDGTGDAKSNSNDVKATDVSAVGSIFDVISAAASKQ